MALHAAAAALASTTGGTTAITNGMTLLLSLVGQLIGAVVEDPILVVYYVAGFGGVALGLLRGLKNL
ncbi:MAG: hypothetical protein HDR00_09285 [Lachnospiraceae bacterium]|nr:hypothetical protein [Lachnospiraceae bacterium]